MSDPAVKKRLLRTALRWSISLAAVAFVAWILPFRDKCTADGCQDGLFTTFRRTNLLLLAGMFVVYLLGTVVWAARWRTLLAVADVPLSLGAAWRVSMEAQAGGILLPGGVGGDALRVAYAKERAPDASIAKITASIMADRVLGLATLATLAFFLALGFDPGKDLRVALPMLGGIPIGALLAWAVLRRPALRDMSIVKSKHGARFLAPMLEYAASPRGPRAVARGFLLSLVVSASQLLVVRGLVVTVGGAPHTEAWLHVGAALSMIVSAVPVSPGAWGTGDAAFVFFFGRAGVVASAAAAVCLLYRLMWYATGAIGAVSAFVRGPRERQKET